MARGRLRVRAGRVAMAVLAGLSLLATAASARADVTITGGHYQLNTTNSARTTLSDNVVQVEHPVFPVTGPFADHKAVQGPAADVSSSLGTVHGESSATENVALTSDSQSVHLSFDGSASGAASDTNTQDPSARILGSGHGLTDVAVDFTVTAPTRFTLSGSFSKAGTSSGTGASASLVRLDPPVKAIGGLNEVTSTPLSGSLDPGRYEVFAIAQADAVVTGAAATESTTASAHATVDFTLGGGSSCPNGQVSQVTAGLALAEGCFTERKDSRGHGTGVFETDQQAWIGGFEVDPQPGGKFVVDSRTPALGADGSGVDVKVGGFFAPIRVQDLPITSSSGTFDLNQAGTIEKAVLNLPIKGKLKASWSDGGKSSSLEGEVTISKFVGSFAFVGTNPRGSEGEIKLKLKQTNRTGLVLNQASVKIDEVTLIPSEFKVPNTLALHNLTLTYELRNGKPFWSGGGGLSIPLKNGPFDIGGRVFFFDGSLAGGGIGVDGINKEIPDTPLFLQKLEGDLLFRPDWAIDAAISTTFGPRLEGKQIATLEGKIASGNLVSPSECPNGNDPFKIEAALKLTPLDNLTSQLAKVETTARTCGYVGTIVGQEATIKGSIEFGNIEAGTVLGFEGTESGFIGQSGFNLEGGVTISIPLLPKINGQAIISNQGLAACGSLNFAQVGFGYRWRQSGLPTTFSGCDLSPFRTTARPAADRGAHAASARAVKVPPGLRLVGFSAKAAGAPPRVKVTGPHGESFISPSAGSVVNNRVVIVPAPLEQTTYVLVHKPTAGSWRIESVNPSVRLNKVAAANGLPRPQVSGRLIRRGRKLVLRYKLTPIAGQQVVFSERGPGGVFRQIGDARSRGGTIAFRPTLSLRRGHVIVAEVTQDGRPRASIVIARFRTPAVPHLTAPARLTAQRQLGTVTLRWRHVAGAGSYMAQVLAGRTVLATTITGRLGFQFKSLPTSGKLVATVRARGSVGNAGPTARADVK